MTKPVFKYTCTQCGQILLVFGFGAGTLPNDVRGGTIKPVTPSGAGPCPEHHEEEAIFNALAV